MVKWLWGLRAENARLRKEVAFLKSDRDKAEAKVVELDTALRGLGENYKSVVAVRDQLRKIIKDAWVDARDAESDVLSRP